MKSTLKILGLATLLAAKTAFALVPEDGWWWNPAQPGVGYNIETQNSTLFVALFIYDDNGSPAWYSGSGTINQNNSVAIDLQRSEGGPCLGCTYTSAQTNSIGKQLVLTFDAAGSTATANLDGATTHIERFSFKLGDGVKQLLGSWIIASMPISSKGILGSGISNYISCNSINSQGTVSCSSATGAGAIFPSPSQDGNMEYIGAVQISEAKNIVYYFKLNGLNNITGISAIVDADASTEEMTSALQNNSSWMHGYRYRN
jgi:hypothetical protein